MKTLDELEAANHLHISEDQAHILSQFEAKKQAKSIYVPTDDTKVRAKLREFGVPICLFGEGVCLYHIVYYLMCSLPNEEIDYGRSCTIEPPAIWTSRPKKASRKKKKRMKMKNFIHMDLMSCWL